MGGGDFAANSSCLFLSSSSCLLFSSFSSNWNIKKLFSEQKEILSLDIANTLPALLVKLRGDKLRDLASKYASFLGTLDIAEKFEFHPKWNSFHLSLGM